MHLSVPVGHQSDGHDVLQHDPGGKQLLSDKISAIWTQALVVKSYRHLRNSLARPDGVKFHALLLDLKRRQTIKTNLRLQTMLLIIYIQNKGPVLPPKNQRFEPYCNLKPSDPQLLCLVT